MGGVCGALLVGQQDKHSSCISLTCTAVDSTTHLPPDSSSLTAQLRSPSVDVYVWLFLI